MTTTMSRPPSSPNAGHARGHPLNVLSSPLMFTAKGGVRAPPPAFFPWVGRSRGLSLHVPAFSVKWVETQVTREQVFRFSHLSLFLVHSSSFPPKKVQEVSSLYCSFPSFPAGTAMTWRTEVAGSPLLQAAWPSLPLPVQPAWFGLPLSLWLGRFGPARGTDPDSGRS